MVYGDAWAIQHGGLGGRVIDTAFIRAVVSGF